MSDSDKDHYSVDEMMSRLRQNRGEGSSGSSGSSGRRRRRSEQPGLKRRKRIRLFMILGLVLLLLLILAPIAMYIGSTFRYKTDEFKMQVSRTVASRVGMTGEVSTVGASGREFSTAVIRLAGEGLFQDIAAENVTARFSPQSFLSSEWQIERLAVNRAAVKLAQPVAGGASEALSESGAENGFGLSGTPTSVSFVTESGGGQAAANFGVQETTMFWGGGTLDESDSLRGLSFSGVVTGKAFGNIEFGGGVLDIEGLKPLRLENGRAEYHDRVLTLKSVRMALHEEGKVAPPTVIVDGGITFRPGKGADLKVGITKTPVEGFLTPEWKGRLDGLLKATATYQSVFASKEPAQIVGQFTIDEAVLRELSVFDALGVLTNSAQVQLLRFKNDTPLSGDFVWQKGKLELKNVKGGAELVRIAGDFTIEGEEKLSGLLRVGLPTAILDNIAPAVAKEFIQGEDGWSWIDVEMGGTLANPQEDVWEKFKNELKGISPRRPSKESPETEGLEAVPTPVGTNRERKLEGAFEELVE